MSTTVTCGRSVGAELSKLLIDIGANLTHPTFNNKELSSVIERARNSGVNKILVTGTSLETTSEAARLCQLYPDYLKFTAGVHPHDAKTFDDNTLNELEKHASNPDCVAIGECGLDFNRNFSPQDQQIAAFKQQVKLACQLHKPLFIHEREAHSSCVDILTSVVADNPDFLLPPTVIHCFTGTTDEAKAYLNMGLYIGLTGFLWKDKLPNGVQAALRDGVIPLERLLVESDAPFMYPNVKNKKLSKAIQAKISEDSLSYLTRYCSFQRNEPCSLATTVDLIAAFMECSPEQVAFNTTANAIKVKLACQLHKPLFIHEREAHSSCVDILTSVVADNPDFLLPPTVIHCFTGTTDEAKAYLNMGLYIGLTGFLWKDKLPNGVQAALRDGVIPLERLLVESDAPFMYPNVKNKKLSKAIQAKISEDSLLYLTRYCSFQRNEPCSLATTVDLIAAFMECSPEQVAFNTTANAIKVFGL